MTKYSGQTVRIERRELFIRQYLIHQNASLAYREAGYKDGPGTRQSAHRLLTSAYVQARISEERQRLLAALDVKVEDLVRRFRDIAFCDISDIVGLHIGPCRYCYGNGHAYQWRTPREYQVFRDEARRLGEDHVLHVSIDQPDGGFGFSAKLPPIADCPECDGHGIPRFMVKDTRLLTDVERAAVAGIEETRFGVTLRFHDRLAALEALAKRVGFYETPNKQGANAVEQLIKDLRAREQGASTRLKGTKSKLGESSQSS